MPLLTQNNTEEKTGEKIGITTIRVCARGDKNKTKLCTTTMKEVIQKRPGVVSLIKSLIHMDPMLNSWFTIQIQCEFRLKMLVDFNTHFTRWFADNS